MRARRIAAVFVALIAAPLRGQQPVTSDGFVLQGQVRHAERDEPAPYSTVDVAEAGVRQFTDALGGFTIPGLPAGTYHVRVRQLGFAPKDTVVTLSATTPRLVLHMRAIPVMLSGVHITAATTCSRTQPDTLADPALVAILSAVRENAEREALLRRAYPFVFQMEATQTAEQSGRRVQHDVDTLRFRSDAFQPYHRGGIVFVDSMMSGKVRRRMRLPTTVDFADAAFLDSHCLTYVGIDHGAHQIAFRPLESIFVPDVEGTVALDSATYVIQSAVVRLTRPWKIDPELASVEARTLYSEVLPGVAIPSEIRTTQTYQHTRGAATGLEVQRMLTMMFLGRMPDGLTAERPLR